MKHDRIRPLSVYVIGYLLFLYIPVFVLPLFSFNDALYVAFPLKGFTWRWYEALFADARIRDAFENSIIVAFIASTVATCAGTMTAYALTRKKSTAASIIVPGALIPLAIPGVVLGVSLLVAVNLIGLGPSLTAVTIGHICVCLPLTIVIMSGRFRAYSNSIEEAAYDLGASDWQVFSRVAIPMTMPGVMSCFILSFTTSFDEFVVSYFLVGAQQTLPLFIWTNLRFVDQLPKILALGSIILVASTILVVWAEMLQRRDLVAGRRS